MMATPPKGVADSAAYLTAWADDIDEISGGHSVDAAKLRSIADLILAQSSELTEAQREIEELRDDRERLRGEVERLREALKPFAEIADPFGDLLGGVVEVCQPHPQNPSRLIQPFLTKHLRNARAALAHKAPGQ